MLDAVREDIEAVLERDPAARSRLEVLLAYPGIHAVLFHRLAHGAWRRGYHTLARVISHLGRAFTGIEIHPGARLGRRVFIDHGMGTVIGETAEIGDDVTLYQGVTLGGTSLEPGKRHPTLADGVIVGAGAKVLGPILVGAGARVAANAVVLEAVAPGVTVVGIPAKPVAHKAPKAQVSTTTAPPETGRPGFQAYGTGCDLCDPIEGALAALKAEVAALTARLRDLEAGSGGPTGPDGPIARNGSGAPSGVPVTGGQGA